MRPLFSGVEILGLKQHHERLAKEAVDRLSPKMLDEDEVGAASRIVAMLTLEAPVIDESRLYAVKNGDEITIHIPFKGDFSIFEVKPSRHAPNPPLGEVDAKESEVLLTYRDAGSTLHERTVREIKQYLEWLRPEITDTKWLKEKVLQQIARRKQGGNC
jgi:formamidopyrimidine-DNA glycosylase